MMPFLLASISQADCIASKEETSGFCADHSSVRTSDQGIENTMRATQTEVSTILDHTKAR